MNYILLLKTLIEAIKAIEALMGKEPGATKLDAAIAITESVVGTVTPILPAVHAVAAIVVSGLNASNIFTKDVKPKDAISATQPVYVPISETN